MENNKIQDILDKVSAQFGEDILQIDLQWDMPVIEVKPSAIHEVLAYLRKEQGFQFLTTLCGLHFPEAAADKQLGVMYQVHNLIANIRLRVKTHFADVENAGVPTAIDIWATANWMERQEYDFFGIKFHGHPDLRRILNMDEMTYFPMRKEYPLEDATRLDKDDTMFGR